MTFLVQIHSQCCPSVRDALQSSDQLIAIEASHKLVLVSGFQEDSHVKSQHSAYF